MKRIPVAAATPDSGHKRLRLVSKKEREEDKFIQERASAIRQGAVRLASLLMEGETARAAQRKDRRAALAKKKAVSSTDDDDDDDDSADESDTKTDEKKTKKTERNDGTSVKQRVGKVPQPPYVALLKRKFGKTRCNDDFFTVYDNYTWDYTLAAYVDVIRKHVSDYTRLDEAADSERKELEDSVSITQKHDANKCHYAATVEARHLAKLLFRPEIESQCCSSLANLSLEKRQLYHIRRATVYLAINNTRGTVIPPLHLPEFCGEEIKAAFSQLKAATWVKAAAWVKPSKGCPDPILDAILSATAPTAVRDYYRNVYAEEAKFEHGHVVGTVDCEKCGGSGGDPEVNIKLMGRPLKPLEMDARIGAAMAFLFAYFVSSHAPKKCTLQRFSSIRFLALQNDLKTDPVARLEKWLVTRATQTGYGCAATLCFKDNSRDHVLKIRVPLTVTSSCKNGNTRGVTLCVAAPALHRIRRILNRALRLLLDDVQNTTTRFTGSQWAAGDINKEDLERSFLIRRDPHVAMESDFSTPHNQSERQVMDRITECVAKLERERRVHAEYYKRLKDVDGISRLALRAILASEAAETMRAEAADEKEKSAATTHKPGRFGANDCGGDEEEVLTVVRFVSASGMMVDTFIQNCRELVETLQYGLFINDDCSKYEPLQPRLRTVCTRFLTASVEDFSCNGYQNAPAIVSDGEWQRYKDTCMVAILPSDVSNIVLCYLHIQRPPTDVQQASTKFFTFLSDPK